MLKVAVLVSGGGTNLQAILDSVQSGEITDTEIVGVISNNPGAYALERGEKAGVPVECISPKSYASRAEFNQEFLKAIDSYEPDLIVLAGFLVVIPPEMIQKYRNRIINIHPALIPAFCGPGMYGHHVHEAVLAYGAKISGATTHFVDEQVDHGGVIMQKSVPVLEGDTPETLAARVLTVEHEILPESVRLFCAEKLGVDGRQVHVL